MVTFDLSPESVHGYFGEIGFKPADFSRYSKGSGLGDSLDKLDTRGMSMGTFTINATVKFKLVSKEPCEVCQVGVETQTVDLTSVGGERMTRLVELYVGPWGHGVMLEHTPQRCQESLANGGPLGPGKVNGPHLAPSGEPGVWVPSDD